MVSPMVSVVLPCYNAAKNLEQCLDSILNQTLTEIEVICVDDGSTDTTLDILRSYQHRDPRICLIQQANAGAGAARNTGLARASGTYLSFLDADDFFEPDMLEKAVAAAEKYEADYIVFRSDRYYPSENRFREIPWSVRNCDLPPYMPFSYRQLTDNIFLSFVGWAWDKLYRRSFVLKHNLQFQQQRTTNDMLFVFSGLIYAKRIAVVQDVLAHQRRESSESLSVTREKSWHCFYDALIALRNVLLRENLYWELEKDFINYSLHFCLWHLNSLAEPSHTLLKNKLLNEWFAELGIADKPESYFWNMNEYAQYLKIVKRHAKILKAEKPIVPSQQGAVSNWQQFEILPEETSAKICIPQDVYKINVKFDRLRNELMQNQEMWEDNQHLYWKNKYHCYQSTYCRLEASFKEAYHNRMGQEFKRAMQLGQLRKDDFTVKEWRTIEDLTLRANGHICPLFSHPIAKKISLWIPQKIKQAIIVAITAVLKTKKKR